MKIFYSIVEKWKTLCKKPPFRMRNGGKENVVISTTDEHTNYLFIITYHLHFPKHMYISFTPINALPFPTGGYINNRGQRVFLHFPLKNSGEVVK